MIRIIFINLSILTVLLVGLELIFGTWFSREHALYQFTQVRDQVITRPNPLPDAISGGIETVTYTRDTYGFRGLDGPVSEIDILTVGGSTTDQRWIDDSQTYQVELERLFEQSGQTIDIVNAGIDGQSTFGHIRNFTSWFSKIPELKPRYILFYVGINDTLILQQTDLYDRMEKPGQLAALKGVIREHSALYQMYRVAQSLLADNPVQHELNRDNIATDQGLTQTPLVSDELRKILAPSLTALSNRVAELDSLTRSLGATPIFVTQRSGRWVRRDGTVWGIATYTPDFFEPVRATLPPALQTLTGVDFHTIERATADTILQTCHEKGAVCLDLMGDVDFDNAVDFYDPIHTTPSGSRRIASYLHQELTRTRSDDLALFGR